MAGLKVLLLAAEKSLRLHRAAGRQIEAAAARIRIAAILDCIELAECWQPIETAPRDGTELLLWDGRIVVGRWGVSSEEWIDDIAWGCFHPTKWMPLPTPPEAV